MAFSWRFPKGYKVLTGENVAFVEDKSGFSLEPLDLKYMLQSHKSSWGFPSTL